MAKSSYEIRVIGALGPAAREAFADLVLDVEPLMTVLAGDLEQSELHALLDRVRALGLELVDVRQAPSQGGAELAEPSGNFGDPGRG